MIRLDGVSKSNGGQTVLHPTRLEVPAGETHVLVGASGSGKSTLLRVTLGLIPADGGTVEIAGATLTPRDARRMRHSIGYVIQDGGLFPHLTAAGNAALVARTLGWTRDRIEGRLKELAALVQLPADLLARYPAQLSGGQRQRVGLMRALMLDPPVLLMDEPLGALDPIIRAQLQSELKRLFGVLRKTVLIVTHDLVEAAYLADRISVMREGRILQTAPFQELRDRPADEYVTRFISAQSLERSDPA
jgi:osmoprotectant transport system ATP-binding protein